MPDWSEILKELQSRQIAGIQSLDLVRREYLLKLHEHTGRNIIAYYSGFLSKPTVEQSEITDEDKNGFMMTIHALDRAKGLDLMLHTPGGSIGATESIVDYLRRMFGNNIRALCRKLRCRRAHMIACSCRGNSDAKHSEFRPD